MARLRVTGGSLRGRVSREPIPPGVRPTTDRVREALFSMVGQDLDGKSWLDAYGGSGIVAIEAWSRGARVTVVERDRRTLGALKRRGRDLGVDWTLVAGDIARVVGRLEPHDIVFADPPYAVDPLPVAERLTSVCRERLIIEAASVASLPPELDGFVRERARSYGRTEVCMYVRQAAD